MQKMPPPSRWPALTRKQATVPAARPRRHTTRPNMRAKTVGACKQYVARAKKLHDTNAQPSETTLLEKHRGKTMSDKKCEKQTEQTKLHTRSSSRTRTHTRMLNTTLLGTLLWRHIFTFSSRDGNPQNRTSRSRSHWPLPGCRWALQWRSRRALHVAERPLC